MVVYSYRDFASVVLASSILLWSPLCVSSTLLSPASPLVAPALQLLPNQRNFSSRDLVVSIRGGTSKSSGKKKKKKKKDSTQSKKAINDKLQEKDAAKALGDAIRDRAGVLRTDDPVLRQIDWSVSSVGKAMGASDQRRRLSDGGGVEASSSSVIANYFLKSHGGAHGLQSGCSLIATVFALGVLMCKGEQQFTLLRRTMIFAMIKHVSGLLAAAAVAAKAIPKIGLSQARRWMEQLVLDPVSQYVFYTALILLWMPSQKNAATCWWLARKWLPPILVGPVLVREVISILLVLSDVLVLSTVGNNSGAVKSLLKVSQSAINAGMSLLVSPNTWRSAKPRERQAILAKLVSRLSLVLEIAVGLILCTDFFRAFVEFAFSSLAHRPSWKETLKRLMCVRVYLHFLWVRRRKISSLAFKIRGGASTLPLYILDVVLDPAKSMGFREKSNSAPPTWMDYAVTALGLEN